jgi:hypothetical protein
MESKLKEAGPGGYYDGYSDMQSTYSTDCEHLNFVMRVSNALL